MKTYIRFMLLFMPFASIFSQENNTSSLQNAYFNLCNPAPKNQFTYTNAVFDRNEWIWHFGFEREERTGDFYVGQGHKKGRKTIRFYGSLSGGFTLPLVYLYLFDRSGYWAEGKGSLALTNNWFVHFRFKAANFFEHPEDKPVMPGSDWAAVISKQTYSFMHEPYVLYGGGVSWMNRKLSVTLYLSGQKFMNGKPPLHALAHQTVLEGGAAYVFMPRLMGVMEFYKNFDRRFDKQYLLTGISYRFWRSLWVNAGLFWHDEADPGSYWPIGKGLYMAPFWGIKWHIYTQN